MGPDLRIRPLKGEDYAGVIAQVDAWWGGRPVAPMIPRLFFEHFPRTSFAVEGAGGEVVGFLCGFVSQADATVAYIHFVGIRPDHRQKGLGRELYAAFFRAAAAAGAVVAKCVTSPVNTGSQAFHRQMGFEAKRVDDYAGRGEDRLVFSRDLSAV